MSRRDGFPRLSECHDCALPIRFVKLDTGTALPVDPLPNRDRGNVAARLVAGRLVGFVISQDRGGLAMPFRFVPHAATCPERPGPDPARRREDDTPLFSL